MHLLQAAELLTGQAAGLAFVIAYAFDLPFGVVFFLVNAPFYVLAAARMGWVFTLRTALCVTGLSLLAFVGPSLLPFGDLNPIAAAVAASVMIAMALLAAFRHRASLGGVGILAVYLQDRTGFRAGWTQLIVDVVVFALGFLVLSPLQVAISFLGALILNLALGLNHRRDRYIAV